MAVLSRELRKKPEKAVEDARDLAEQGRRAPSRRKVIFAEGEMEERAVVNYSLTTALDGKTYQVAHYHLDAVLAVGYRVRSLRGTQFRR